MSGHQHEARTPGRSIEALGLFAVTDVCRTQHHTIIRTTLPMSETDPTLLEEICVNCTEIAGRLEGLRLWQSVCPCCFSTAFPHGLPSREALHAKTSAPSAPARRST